MPFSLSMDLQQKPGQSLKQLQHLIMSRQMQQAIHFLQAPVMELSPLIEMEMEQNPVLEYQEEADDEPVDHELQQLEEEVKEDPQEIEATVEKELTFDDKDFEIMRRLDEDFRDHFDESGSPSLKRSSEEEKLQTFLESSICDEPSLFEHLVHQAHEAFQESKEREMAEILIGSLDESGFLITPLQEIAILQNCSVEMLEKILLTIQTFHPIGIGARNLRECLLIQLRHLGKQETLAYAIVDKYFEDLLHNHIPAIKKGLHCSSEEIGETIDCHIVHLDLHPGTQISRQVVSCITPDITLKLEEENLVITLNDDVIPPLRLNRRYLRMLDDTTLNQETKEFIQKKVISAKWLLRNIMQRNSTLERIGEVLAKRQRDFFLNPEGNIVPLTMKMVADELELHESTIARAVSNKYIDTPRGLLPLRFFFTSALTTEAGGEVSSHTARDLVQELISKEDKAHPLSDEIISGVMKDKGIQCARRTVAKYRVALGFGTAQQRRKF